MGRKRKPPNWKEIKWEVLFSALSLGGLVFFSWLNASKFDSTEYQTIGEAAIYLRTLQSLKDKVLG